MRELQLAIAIFKKSSKFTRYKFSLISQKGFCVVKISASQCSLDFKLK